MDEQQIKALIDAAIKQQTETLLTRVPEIVKESIGGLPTEDRVGELIGAALSEAAEANATLDEAKVIELAKASTAEAIDALKKEQAEAAGKAEAEASVKAARDTYIAENMGNVPKVYAEQMPVTDDAEALAKAEKDIREQYATDSKAAGGTLPDIGSKADGASPATASVDANSDNPSRGLKDIYAQEQAGG